MRASPPSPSQPAASIDAAPSDEDFFDGLDPETIASLAYDRSSNFSLSPTTEEVIQEAALAGPHNFPAKEGTEVIEGEKPWPRSLLEEFYDVNGYEKIVLPPGPARTTTSSTTLPSDDVRDDVLDPFIPEPANQPSSGITITPAPILKPTPQTPSSKPSAKNQDSAGRSPEGRPSNAALEQCHESFVRIEEIFIELAHLLQRPVGQVKKWFFSGFKGSRSTSDWNLYQAYFSKHREEELARCGLEVGTDKDCWPSFRQKFGTSVEAYLRAVLDLDRVKDSKETLQQRSRNFQKHCSKLEKLNEEGVESRFQTFAVIVGDCLQEDQGLGSIVATPGLAKFIANRLKIEESTMLGLVKCEAYHAVAEKVSENVDPVKLVNDLNKTFDALEAELKGAEARDEEDDTALEDDSNVILSCKKHLIALLKTATEAAGQRWANDRLPWSTLPNYLVGISHVIKGWPPSCAMPHETSKPNKMKKGKQGIKDLGNKDGRLLLAALQEGELKIIKADLDAIKNDEIAVISTAAPTTSDSSNVYSRCIYASGKTTVGKRAPISAAVTRVKRRRKIIEIDSDDDEIILPPAAAKVSLYRSSDSEEKPTATQKRIATVDIDSNDGSPVVEKNKSPHTEDPPPPSVPNTLSTTEQPPSIPNAATKQPPSIPNTLATAMAITSPVIPSVQHENSSDTNKRRRLSLPDASKDPFGSGDDYVQEGDEESETGVARSPRTRRTRSKGKGRSTKGKEKEKERANHAPTTTLAQTKTRTNTMKSAKSTSAPDVKHTSMPSSAHSVPGATTMAMVTTATPATTLTTTSAAAAAAAAAPPNPSTAAALKYLGKCYTRPATPTPASIDTATPPPAEMPPPRPKISSTSAPKAVDGPQAAAHRSRLGQKIVDTFPPSKQEVEQNGTPSTVVKSIPINGTESGTVNESSQAVGSMPPSFSEPGHFDVPMDSVPYFSHGYDGQYDAEMYNDDNPYPMETGYMSYDAAYDFPPRFTSIPPRGDPRYARHPYLHQGSNGLMRYQPASRGAHPASAMRYRLQYGPPRGRGRAPNNGPGPSARVPSSSNMGSRNYSDQYWGSSGQYDEEEIDS
ncbi:hypothetical protein C0992_002761 [Termitomyces sp. T32_za158]|nr:hypothetical protein C0992_002761 [Termitomyces sp. T32_za158]